MPDAAPAAAPADAEASPAPPPVEPVATAPAPETSSTPSGTAMSAAQAMPSPQQARRIQIGDVLNHTYEVRRFIARGGMGEVFEGVNVNAEDDRVAIKVMLPHLAADPLVQAMFSKEAKTLTRLRHPGLVQYRMLGREPQLGVTYIVTEFVDGVNLSDVLKTLDTTPEDQLTLLKRLAAALGAAHELDAVHRDISPDNVLLEGGRLKDAKIIDFGIAKDLDAGAKTIVGDGFAGKLNYVAPEQLGSYGRSVGAWSDVYSLALVMLAVARKKDVDMGGSLADAFDKRKDVPDLSEAPEQLRPILAKMLVPDPADRLRSMDAVLAEVAAQGGGGAAFDQATRVQFQPGFEAPKKSNTGLLVGGGAAVLLALAAGGYFLFGRGPSDPQGAAQTALATGLRDVPCSWLDVGSVQARDATVDVALRGVSGKPDKAKADVGFVLEKAGLKAGDIDFSDVKTIAPTDCSPIDAFRQVRDYEGARLNTTKRQYEMANQAGTLAADPEIEIDTNNFADDFALFGMEETGAITPLIKSKSELGQFVTTTPRPGVTSFKLTTDHKGWSGILLLKGKGPFDPTLLEKGPGEVSPSWVNRFLSTAKAQGWKSEMIWYRTVDEKPG
ncbi:serine/threonine-protein kinase [Novosphingobium sp. Gsoil 351]|uniref:serine/threonine-protein kinase n=1 Tax=Novosphingobium sp. Gsoil 351 TaxID=2675225 RepID=UPI0018A86903|nr:serine/threonine-protein kinase [Novosphingobium sp. Gsoil 351]